MMVSLWKRSKSIQRRRPPVQRFALRLVGALLAGAFAVPLFASPATHVVVLRGLGGDPEMEDRFRDWSARLSENLVTACGIPASQVHVYPAPLERDESAPLTREAAEAALADVADVAGSLTRDDAFVLFLIGHGSLQREAKFMVEGPDIAASDLGQWLEAIPPHRQVIVNTASSSAAFINTLSAPGRIICTSTRSGIERNAPEFMEHFLRVLEEGRGDVNRDGEVTLLELCNAAAADTQAWFESEGYIATEHALLDDNGDARGSRLPLDESGEAADGDFARDFIVQPDAAMAAADPALVARYRAAIASVKALAAEKESLAREEYWNRLESLLLEAARLNRNITDNAGAPEE